MLAIWSEPLPHRSALAPAALQMLIATLACLPSPCSSRVPPPALVRFRHRQRQATRRRSLPHRRGRVADVDLPDAASIPNQLLATPTARSSELLSASDGTRLIPIATSARPVVRVRGRPPADRGNERLVRSRQARAGYSSTAAATLASTTVVDAEPPAAVLRRQPPTFLV